MNRPARHKSTDKPARFGPGEPYGHEIHASVIAKGRAYLLPRGFRPVSTRALAAARPLLDAMQEAVHSRVLDPG